ncbi:type IX secretion system membrane protein PorP/SprF [Pontibacter silvestris]|uniref:Type IX secretion system membrane protein PorP/SprF n=1 Tax=Pontibacter silvestris TaxID=2305183 RepID=A0ABW4WSU0_9BACT|nr:type IX secretion system membrane protein PorP/SprF [Pontibacter silvestris]MCC9138418.1 type IX secretion system membrane protein PorP/SprF [Pontibacter silvestris]
MKALLLLPFLFFLCCKVSAQQHPQLTQYMQNNYLANPAVAGVEDYGDVRAGFRSQWVGLERAPTTFYMSIHAALNKNDRNVTPLRLQHRRVHSNSTVNRNNRFYRKPHHGAGAIAQVDMAGMIRASTLNLSYAYHLPLTQRATLSGGVSAGFTQLAVNHSFFLQTPNDPLLFGDTGNLLRTNLGLGLWLYGQDYYIGISGTQLLGGGIKKPDAAQQGPRALLQPHYYFTGGYRLQVSPGLTLTPSVMAKAAANGQTAVDLNLKALYAQRFWAGISYRHKDAMAGMVGVYLNHLLDVSYSYDFAISEMSSINSSSHEVVVGLKFNNPSKIVCPKYMW